MRRIFWGFCRNWFLISPLHYLSNRSDFGLKLAEIFIFEKRLPTITDTGNRRLRVSVIRGVATPRITDTRSPQYEESASEFFKRKLSVSMTRRLPAPAIRWVADPRIVESESRRLRVSRIRRVEDSAYHWVGESTTPRIGDTGSRYSKKKLIWSQIF